jgi:hypothetical protein
LLKSALLALQKWKFSKFYCLSINKKNQNELRIPNFYSYFKLDKTRARFRFYDIKQKFPKKFNEFM